MSQPTTLDVGDRFGSFTVVRFVDANRVEGRRWAVRCDCGAEFVRPARVLTRSARTGRPLRCAECRDVERMLARGDSAPTDPAWRPREGHECDERCKMVDVNRESICCLSVVAANPDGMEFYEIGNAMGFTAERARQIFNDAVAKSTRRGVGQ